MPHTRSFADVRAELADEHRQVMGLVARIQATRSESLLPELLKSLHDLLVNHFAHEQFPGGLYESMGANRPEHHDALTILVREHCEILSTARALVEHANLHPTDDNLRDDIGCMLELLHQHETREHALAQTIAETIDETIANAGPQTA